MNFHRHFNITRKSELVYVQMYPPDFPITKIASGITLPNAPFTIIRKNSNVFTFEYVEDGEGTIQHDGMIQKVEKGDMFILHANAYHKYSPDTKKPWTRIWVSIEGNLKYVSDLIADFGLNDLIYIPKINTPLRIKHIIDLMSKNTYIPHKVIATLVHTHILELSDYKLSKTYTIPEHIKMYLDARIDGIANLDDLAKYIGLGKTQIINHFTKAYNITPMAYLTNIRIEKAKELLLNPEYSLSKIASKLSFSSTDYFSKVFKKQTGFSPNQYRHLNMK